MCSSDSNELSLYCCIKQTRKPCRSKLEQSGRRERRNIYSPTSSDKARLVPPRDLALRSPTRQGRGSGWFKDLQASSGWDDGTSVAASMPGGSFFKKKITPSLPPLQNSSPNELSNFQILLRSEKQPRLFFSPSWVVWDPKVENLSSTTGPNICRCTVLKSR